MSSTRFALLSIPRRPLRSALSAAAIAIGAASVVLLISISQSAAAQIALRLSAYDVNTITVSLPVESWSQTEESLVDAARLLSSVTAAGTFVAPGGDGAVVSIRSASGLTRDATVIVSSSHGLAARDAAFETGGIPAWTVSSRDETTIVVGSALARHLGLSVTPGTNLVTVDGQPMTVVGVARDGARNSLVSGSITVSPATAELLGIDLGTRTFLVTVMPGAADGAARMLPYLLDPLNPGSVSVTAAPTPAVLSGQLSADTRSLVLIVALVVLGTTAFGIATTMQIAVWERRLEIGVRRAHGESRSSIGLTFLLEATLICTGGSILGWMLGVIGSALVTRLLEWPFFLPAEAMAAILLGTIVGGVSGLIPAIQASKVDPIIMLRA